MSASELPVISNLEYHVLLALAAGQLYGYAITTAVEEESGGVISPRAGSLYRVLGRLMEAGLIDETEPTEDENHPGRARRWYRLTPAGRIALSAEAERLGAVAELARRRLELGRS